MRMDSSKVVMLVDFDYFFAQCEELRNPAIKGKPVVIGVYSGRTEESGAVSTANYVARKYGVRSGMPLFLAKRKLEGVDAAFLPVDHDYYEQVSSELMDIFRDYADVFEIVGIDEAYLDVTLSVRGSFEEARNLAERMKTQVRRDVGVTFSIGIGPNKLVAKIASDEEKPDGLTIVRPDEVKGFLSPLPVDRLLGVGHKTFLKMAKLGIHTIHDLSTFDVQRLVQVFGKLLGVYFHNAANGVDEEPVKESGEAESISRIGTLKQDTKDLDLVLAKTNELTEDILSEILEEGMWFKQVGIIAVLNDLRVRSRMQTLEQPSKSLSVLRDVVRGLLEKFLQESDKEVRRIGVKVSQLSKEEIGQKRLESYFGT